MQKKEESYIITLWSKHYDKLKRKALSLTRNINREDLHQDLLHDCIHLYLSSEKKEQIIDPVAWIAFVMYREVNLPGSAFNIKYIHPSRKHVDISDRSVANRPVDDHSSQMLILRHMMNDLEFAGRTFMNMKLQGYSNKQIAELFELPYDTVCRVIREATDKLAGMVKNV